MSEITSAAEAIDIASEFIEPHYPWHQPLKAVRERNIWLIEFDVGALRVETVYTLKLKRRGVVLGPKLDTDALSQVTVEEAMTKRVRTIKEGFTLDRITKLLEQSPHTGFPVVNEFNDVVGLITYTELHQVLEDPEKRSQPIAAKDIMRKKPPTVTPDTLLQQAMTIMEDQHVDRLPVVDADDPKKLKGIVTKGDIAVSLHKLLKANM